MFAMMIKVGVFDNFPAGNSWQVGPAKPEQPLNNDAQTRAFTIIAVNRE